LLQFCYSATLLPTHNICIILIYKNTTKKDLTTKLSSLFSNIINNIYSSTSSASTFSFRQLKLNTSTCPKLSSI
jgi:hypothetical protein